MTAKPDLCQIRSKTHPMRSTSTLTMPPYALRVIFKKLFQKLRLLFLGFFSFGINRDISFCSTEWNILLKNLNDSFTSTIAFVNKAPRIL